MLSYLSFHFYQYQKHLMQAVLTKIKNYIKKECIALQSLAFEKNEREKKSDVTFEIYRKRFAQSMN